MTLIRASPILSKNKVTKIYFTTLFKFIGSILLCDKNKKEINGTLCFRISIDTLVNLTSSKFLTIGTPKIFCFIQIEEGYVAIETYSFHIKFISIEVNRKYITFQQPLIENTSRENESMKNLHRICFRPQ
jgi:hypothetical protein